MIRPLRFETARYGEYSKSGEFVYDHPFQWGSKRTGPDLAREGGLRSDYWHYQHMIRPKDVSDGSIMPAYPWMNENELDLSLTEKKINAMRTLGVPYKKGYEKQAVADAKKQAEEVATRITNELAGLVKGIDKEAKIAELKNKEIVALIAYLQRLGTDIKAEPKSDKTK
jgi:cytochrome c oxidase cbb3-type subunit I/II